MKQAGNGGSAGRPDTIERRSGDDRRDLSLKRLKVVLSGSIFFDGQCRRLVVTNISRTGLAGKTELPLAKGDPVEVSLGGDGLIAATVVWTRAGRFGAQFGQAIELDAYLPSGVAGSDLYRELERRASRMALLELERSGRLVPGRRGN